MTTKRFTGQYHEAGLTGGEGLSYYGARWYDAKLGRFLSADTIVPGPGNPQTFNRYSYVANNPLRFVDPSGHSLAEFDPGPGGGSSRTYQRVTMRTLSAFGPRFNAYIYYTDRTFSWRNIFTALRQFEDATLPGMFSADVRTAYDAWGTWGERNIQRMPESVQAIDKILKSPMMGIVIDASLGMPPGAAHLDEGNKLVSFFKSYDNGTAFSGAFDTASSRLAFRPSTEDVRLAYDTSNEWVYRRGGHAVAASDLSANRDEWRTMYGFTVQYIGDEQLKILSWTSGTLNSGARNHPPADVQGEIVKALHELTGLEILTP